MRENPFTRIAPTPQAEETWVRHLDEIAVRTILYDTNSWFMGANIPGKKRAILLYAGNAATYRKECQEAATKGYEGFVLQ